VIVQKPESRAFASVDQMIRATLQWVAIALAFAVLAAIIFASGIARPIRVLAERTHEIARGNYQQRVQLKTHNEIGELAANFNVMSSSIEKAVEQLKKAAHENHLLFINSVRMLAAAIDAKDPYTRGHLSASPATRSASARTSACRKRRCAICASARSSTTSARSASTTASSANRAR
jgi:HAMP domain-containing protein